MVFYLQWEKYSDLKYCLHFIYFMVCMFYISYLFTFFTVLAVSRDALVTMQK